MNTGNSVPPLPVAVPPVIPQLTSDELAELRYAKSLLEQPGLAARLANVLGRPIEQGLAMLPAGALAAMYLKRTTAEVSKADAFFAAMPE